MAPNPRNAVFISYAHEDQDLLERFLVHLSPLERSGVRIWVDRQIKPGDKWYEEIRGAIDQSRRAILLISPDFLASTFIIKEELKLLRAARDAGALRVLWIALGPADFGSNDLKDFVSEQALNDIEKPISTMQSIGEREQAFADICKKIKASLELGDDDGNEETGGRGAERRRKAKPNLPPPLRTFTVRPLESAPSLMDAVGQLWVTEGQQVKIFHAGHDTLRGREMLPNRPWKPNLQEIWRGRLVLADWSGTIYQFDGQAKTRERPFYEAKHDDAPIHCLAAGPTGRLFAAAWDGKIRIWDAEGRPHTGAKPIVLPALPVLLAPLADGGLAVADQARRVHVYASSGEELWSWPADDDIHRLWACEEDSESALAAQIGTCRLVKLVQGRLTDEIGFPTPLRFIARRPQQGGAQWTAVVCEGGRFEWLSLRPFTKLEGLQIDFPIRQIAVVADLQKEDCPMAVGLTEEGRLFTLEELSVRRYEHPEDPVGIRQLFPDPTGRFLYSLFGRRIEVYRNPVVKATACRMELDGVVGSLKVNNYRRLVVKLENSGVIPIQRIEGELVAGGVIESRKASANLREPLLPGRCVDLDFSVRVKVPGDLRLELKLDLADEGGPLPSPATIQFDVHSEEA